MAPPLRFVGYLTSSAITTPFRRLFKGPRRENWPYGFEVVWGALRRNFEYVATLSPEAARAHQEKLAQPLKLPVTREAVELDGVPAERFRPEEPSEGAALLYLHGGAYIFGSSNTHAEIIARLAQASGLETWAVNYRLRPEHPIEEAIEDVVRAHQGLEARGLRVVWAGDSSGGGLAVSAMFALLDEGASAPRGAALLSPWVDLRCERPSYTENEDTDWGSAAGIRAQAELALGDEDPTDPRFSPALRECLVGLPPLLLHAGDSELICDDVVAFSERLQEAGVEHQLTLWPNMVHNFQLFAELLPVAEEAIEDLGAFLAARVAA